MLSWFCMVHCAGPYSGDVDHFQTENCRTDFHLSKAQAEARYTLLMRYRLQPYMRVASLRYGVLIPEEKKSKTLWLFECHITSQVFSAFCFPLSSLSRWRQHARRGQAVGNPKKILGNASFCSVQPRSSQCRKASLSLLLSTIYYSTKYQLIFAFKRSPS